MFALNRAYVHVRLYELMQHPPDSFGISVASVAVEIFAVRNDTCVCVVTRYSSIPCDLLPHLCHGLKFSVCIQYQVCPAQIPELKFSVVPGISSVWSSAQAQCGLRHKLTLCAYMHSVKYSQH